MNNNKTINKVSDNIRILIAAMVEKAKSGHPGGAMGAADFINILYSEFMVYDPENPEWESRDRFYLDPGHMSPMLYATLALAGKYSMDDLKNFRQWQSPTPGHPERNILRGIENTSGPLGQGHAYAVGAAIAAKYLRAKFGDIMDQTIYAFISDGGIQEEISQGAGRMAGHLGLDNLIMFYDSNDVQLSTDVDAVTSEDVAAKYRAWDWKVIEINGNDPDEIRAALTLAKAEKEKPTLIIGKTIMGKGVVTAEGEKFEGQCSTHGQPLSKSGASFEATVRNLGGNPDDPFVFFDESVELYAKRKEQLKAIVAEKKAKKAAWAEANPELAKKLDMFFSGKLPEIDWSAIKQKDNAATRAASANVLGVLAEHVENMIVSSADLCNSDKTDGFLKKTHEIRKGDFSGAFLQAGVSELTMACVCIGIMLHGGMWAACGTFFVFSDYMKPALRMAALMEIPVKFIYSHDAFRVGEDGPTHHGMFDMVCLRTVPNLTIAAPYDEHELRRLMYTAQLPDKGPFVIRYPRGRGRLTDWKCPLEEIEIGKGRKLKEGKDLAVISLGPIGYRAAKAIERVEQESGISVAHYDLRFVKPLDTEMLEYIGKNFKKVITIEDGILAGGAGSTVMEFMSDHGYDTKIIRMGLEDHFVQHGSVDELYKICGLDEDSIYEKIKNS